MLENGTSPGHLMTSLQYFHLGQPMLGYLDPQNVFGSVYQGINTGVTQKLLYHFDNNKHSDSHI